jgi:hypothetical protein
MNDKRIEEIKKEILFLKTKKHPLTQEDKKRIQKLQQSLNDK